MEGRNGGRKEAQEEGSNDARQEGKKKRQYAVATSDGCRVCLLFI